MAEIDVERLAAGYRHRPPSEVSLARADRVARRAGLGAGSLAVDVGGGLGHHAGRFAGTGARAVVVDRSETMAVSASRQDGVVSVVGDGARLPLRGDVADLVFFHTSIHYGAWREMLAEAVRVMRPGGLLSVWTFRPDHARRSFLARWFPSVAYIDEGRFPSPEAIADRLASLGVPGRVVLEDERVVRSAGSWVTAVRAGFVSTLQLLPEAEIEAGISAFERAFPDPAAEVGYDLRYAEVSGRKASLR